MKRALSFILVLTLCFVLCACGKVDTAAVDRQLQGNWSSVDSQGSGAEYLFLDGRFACKTLISGFALSANEGSYEITAKAIELHYDNGVDGKLSYTFKNGTLNITDLDLVKVD